MRKLHDEKKRRVKDILADDFALYSLDLHDTLACLNDLFSFVEMGAIPEEDLIAMCAHA